jgi:four helix bundle protein
MDIKKTKYIELKDLEVYRLGRELSRIAWEIYEKLDWQVKKIIGDQFITSADSFGANIAEGYGRYHYLDKIKFFYNARGSLVESIHWVEVMGERNQITKDQQELFEAVAKESSIKLQNFISAIYKLKNTKSQ